jgi:exopolysaccharide production protein ExoZ
MARIGGIEILRGLAATAVVVHHTLPAFTYGKAGVDVFFVISGFVMVVSSAKAYGVPGAWQEFLHRRILRIVPLYWLMTVATIMLLPGYFSWDEILRSLFFLPVFSHGVGQPVVRPGWTLILEMYFYLIFAAFLFLRPVWSAFAVTACIATTVILRMTVGDHYFLSNGYGNIYSYTIGYTYGDPIVFEFAEGMFLGLMRLRGVALPAWAGFLALIASLGMVGLFPERTLAWHLASVGIVAAGGLSSLYPSSRPFEAIAGFAGAVSYATYLVQAIAIGHYERRGVPHALIISLTVAVGAAVHFLVERPIYFIISIASAWLAHKAVFFKEKIARSALQKPRIY